MAAAQHGESVRRRASTLTSHIIIIIITPTTARPTILTRTTIDLHRTTPRATSISPRTDLATHEKIEFIRSLVSLAASGCGEFLD